MQPSGGFTIKTVAERTGVPLHTLRAWERRYGVPRPSRGTHNRYRLFDEDDIADVLWMKRQIAAGLTPSQASLLLRQAGREALPTAAPTMAQPLSNQRAALQAALFASDVEQAQRILDETLALFTPEQVAQQVIEPTLYAIGERWQSGEASAWQEHLASNLMRQRLLSVLQAQPGVGTHAPRLIAACAPAEQHELGLLIFALLARRQGWSIFYLGQRTPLAELCNAQHARRPQLVALSVSTVVGLNSLIPLLDEGQRPARLLFGGHLFKRVPRLRERVPGSFMAEEALTAAQALMTTKLIVKPWTPAPKKLRVARVLQAQRLKLAGDTVAQLHQTFRRMAQRPDPQTWQQATLFLLDTLACALAFDAPELIDAEGAWLNQTLPLHAVPPTLVAQHLDAFTRVTNAILASADARALKAFLSRLRDGIAESKLNE